MVPGSVALAVDFGTSNTVAMLRRGAGPPTPLLFDASPMLPSSVFAGPDGDVLTGADAERAASGFAAGLEANPKRRVGEGTVWLGERELPVVDVVAAVLARVGAEAVRVAGQRPSQVVLTHPVAWSRTRLGVLAAAARAAGLGEVGFVAEPVAAAAYFASVLGHEVPVDHCLVVYDLGGGTFDVTVLRRRPDGFVVVATGGLPDLGGLDLDATVVEHARSLAGSAAQAWAELDWPQTPAGQRARRLLWRDAQAVKEQLSRHVRADLHIPLVDTEVQLTREEFDKAARPLLEQTVEVMLATLRETGVARERIAGVFLVGGSSRVPLAASLLHRALNVAPTIIEQPELVVAGGALHAMPPPPAMPPSPAMAPPGMAPPGMAPPQPMPALQPMPARQPMPALAPTRVEMPALPPVHGETMAPRQMSVPGREPRRRWWIPAAVAAFVAVGAVVVVVNYYANQRSTEGQRQAGSTPPATSSHRPSAGPSGSPSAVAAGPTTAQAPARPAWIGGVPEAKRFIPRLPAQIRAMKCKAEATPTTPAIPTVTCGDLQKTSIIYSLYPNADDMYSDFNSSLDPNVSTSGDCAKSQSHVLTTYTRGTHRGRILCEAEPSSGFVGWTDDTTLVWGQIPPSSALTYTKTYDLWTLAVDIGPP